MSLCVSLRGYCVYRGKKLPIKVIFYWDINIIWSFVAVMALILAFKISWDLSSRSTYDKISTKRGVDIYIDNENKVAYISLNNNTSEEAIAKIKEGLKNSETYEIIVMENINNINFLK